MDGPDARGDALGFGMVGGVVVAWEADVCYGDCEEFEEEQNVNVVGALFAGYGVGGRKFTFGFGGGRLGRDAVDACADTEHHRGHNPVGVLAHKGTAGDEGICDDPDVG